MEHIDWHPARWAVGTAGLTMEQIACYFTLINDTYLLGDFPIEDAAALAGRLGTNARRVKRVIDELVGLGKLHREDGRLVANGCVDELERVQERMATARRNGRRGGRKSKVSPTIPSSLPNENRLQCGSPNKLDTETEHDQSLSEPGRFATIQNKTINPLSPFQTVDEEGQPSPTSEAPKPEAPAPAEHPADPEREAPGEPSPAAPEPPVTRASPRSHGTNPRAKGTNPRALGLNPRSLAQGPPPLPVALPDAPEPVPRMFEAVLREFGEAAYRSWLVPLEVRSVNGAVVLAAKSPFDRDWIERRYGDAMRRVAGMPVQIIAGSS